MNILTNDPAEVAQPAPGAPADASRPPAEACRIVVFAPELPYPPDHGGRLDCWRRIKALRAQGHTVMLVCFYDDYGRRPDEAVIRAVKEHVQVLIVRPLRKPLIARLAPLSRTATVPWHAAARAPHGRSRRDLYMQVADFRPDLLWLEGPQAGELADACRRRLRCPMIYRSHNVEHVYRRQLARASGSLVTSLRLLVTTVHLKRYQLRLMRRSELVLDISEKDADYWRTRGVDHVRWLPPLAESPAPRPPLTPADADAGDPIDVLFLGNLHTPNNVEGVRWLVEEVAPRVLRQRPQTRFVLAGSRPSAQARGFAQRPGIELIADVGDPAALQRRAHVLVNPVRRGSGVNIKAIDMLMTDLPLVSTSTGTEGLPDFVRAQFDTHDDADGFAAAIVRALEAPPGHQPGRVAARATFSGQTLLQVLHGLPAGPGGRASHALHGERSARYSS